MTMIEEEVVRQMLADIASVIKTPPQGVAAILVAAGAIDHPPRRIGSVRLPKVGMRRRLTLVTSGIATAVLVMGGVVGFHVASRSSVGNMSPIQAIGGGAGNASSGAGNYSSSGGGSDASAGTGGSTGAGVSGGGAACSNCAGGASNDYGAGATSIGGSTASGIAAPINQAQVEPARAGGLATTGPASPPVGRPGQTAKIQETGSLSIRIKKGEAELAMQQLVAIAVSDGGFSSSTSIVQAVQGSDPITGNVTLQVPVGSFDDVVSRSERLGKVTSLTSQAQDLTGQFIDLQSRITALQSSRTQYLSIMTKASSISDILSVQNQLDNLQQQIEQLQGQLNTLNTQTTYATLTVAVAEPGASLPAAPPPPPSGISAAWHDAVSGFAHGIDWLVGISGPLLFTLILLGVLALLVRWAWKRWTKRIL